jgi:SAM-dependent methyltransferase
VEDETGFFKYLDRWRARERRVKQILKRSNGQGRILDVGCSTGIFLSGLQRHGWECYGVEPDLKAAEYARKRFGVEVFHGYLEDAGFPDNYFDVVTMIDVLEHVYDPMSTLREVNRIVKLDGVFFGNLPNADAWERFLFEPYWVGWDVPRHYNVYTRKTVRQLLEAQGFKDVNLFSFTGRHGAFMLSLKFWLDDRGGPVLMKKLIINIIGSLPFRVLMLPIFILFERFNISTGLSFSARKV